MSTKYSQLYKYHMYSKFNEKTVQIQENANIMIMYCEYLKKKKHWTMTYYLKCNFLTPVKKKFFFKTVDSSYFFMTMQWLQQEITNGSKNNLFRQNSHLLSIKLINKIKNFQDFSRKFDLTFSRFQIMVGKPQIGKFLKFKQSCKQNKPHQV